MAEHSSNQDSRGFMERGLHWPVMLVGMFLVSASFVITTGILGAGTGSKMIEPDYYSRAVDWDSERDRLEAAARLGWTVRVAMSKPLDPKGTRIVSALILDMDDNPIQDAHVDVISFAASEAHDRFLGNMQHVGAGQYQHRFEGMHTVGVWECRVSIQAHDEQALVVVDIELVE